MNYLKFWASCNVAAVFWFYFRLLLSDEGLSLLLFVNIIACSCIVLAIVCDVFEAIFKRIFKKKKIKRKKRDYWFKW